MFFFFFSSIFILMMRVMCFVVMCSFVLLAFTYSFCEGQWQNIGAQTGRNQDAQVDDYAVQCDDGHEPG